jgi:hypothetical protein
MVPTASMHKILFKSQKKCDEYSGKLSERKYEPYMVNGNSPKPEMARQAKNKIKSMLIIFFYNKGIAHKEFVIADENSKFRILL